MTIGSVEMLMKREASWSSGQRRGLTIQAMVLGRGFESRLHLKTRWKDGPLDGRETVKIINLVQISMIARGRIKKKDS